MNEERQEFLQALKAHGLRENIPNISFFSAEILQFFLRISDSKNIFEIGCANGFSTIFLADHAEQVGGKVVTCDVSEPSMENAKENIQNAGLQQFVEFRFGSALKALKEDELFDCIFIDGQKSRTHEFFELAKKHLLPGGIVIIDDTKKFPVKMQEFYDMRTKEQEFTFFDIPVDADDSMTVAFQKN